MILADDGSTDGSVEFIEANYPDVRVLVNRRPLGFVANCNAAADAATGRILVLLNNDTEPDPAWLEKLALDHLRPPGRSHRRQQDASL